MQFRVNRVVAALALGACAPLAHAAGFALIEQNASGLGNAYAGSAAVAADASTIYFNPAGMTALPDSQVVLAGHFVKLKAEFSGSVTPNVGGGTGGDAGGLAFIPSAYYAQRITPDLHVGLGLNAPFGLKTEYDADWIGRYQAIESEVKTVNVNPSIAYRISEQFSIGAGLNLQYLDTTLSSAGATVEGDDHGWGFNLGGLWQATPTTRIGLAYRSEIDFDLTGRASFSAMPALNGEVRSEVTMPDSASLSLFQKLDPRWDLLADVTWTGWSDFDKLAIYRSSGALLSYTPENWEDILRYSLGLTRHVSEKLSLRAGVAYDEGPVSDADRTPRIPDGARTWIALGGQWRVNAASVIDVGYAHLFVDEVSLNSPAAGTIPTSPRLTGEYDSAVDVLSAQLTVNF